MKKSTPTIEEVTQELEKLRAEFELYKKNHTEDYRYKLIVDNISDVLFTCTLSFELTYLSPSAQYLFGAPLDTLYVAQIHQLFPPQSIAFVQEVLQKELQDDSLEKALAEPYVTNEIQMYKFDGSSMWVSLRTSFSRDIQGKPTGVIGVLRDITRSKLAQLEFQRMQLLDEQMSQLARVGAWEVDFENNTIFWSDMTKIIHEVDLDFVPDLSKGVNFYNQGADREEIIRLVTEAKKHGTPYSTELQIVTAKGNERWVRTVARPEMKDGKCVKLVGAFQDIDELKRVQIEHEKAHQLYVDIARNSRTMVWEVDANGLFLHVSPVCADIIGYTSDELIGKMHFYDLHPEDSRDQFFDSIMAVFKQKQSFMGWINPLQTKDGATVYVSTNAIPVVDDNGNLLGYKGSDTDITQQTIIKTAFDKQTEFQALIASISKDFVGVTVDNFDDKFVSLLQQIGDFLQVDRTYLFEISEDEQYMSNTFEWCADGIFSVKDMLQNYPIADLPMIEQILKKRQLLFVPNVDELPDIYTPERVAMQEQGIKTVLVLPVVKNERLFGYFGFDAVKQTREVPAYQIELLQVVANMIGDVLLKNALDKANEQYLQQVLQQEREKRALLASMDDLVFVLDVDLVLKDFYQPKNTNQLYLSPDVFIGKSFKNIPFPEPARTLIIQTNLQCLATGEPQSVEYFLDFEEDRRWFDLRITPLKNEQKDTVGLVCVARDLTNAIIQKQALMARDELLKKLAAQTPGMVYQYQMFPDGHSCFSFSSDHIFDIYEVLPCDVVHDASAVIDRLHPDNKESVINKIVQSYHNLTIWEDIYRVVLPSSGIKWLKGSATPQKLDDGSVMWHGYIFDYTAIKEAEIELQKTKERLELAVNGTNDGIFDWDIAEDTHYLSPRWKSMLGYTDDELSNVHATFESLLHPEDRDTVLKRLSDYINGVLPDYSVQFRMIHKDGSLRWILARGKVVCNKDGKAIRFAGSHTDVTDQQLVMQRLEEQNDFIQSLINTMPDLIFYKDIHGIYKLCNERFALFNNTTIDNLIGTKDADIVSPEFAKMFADTDAQVVATKESVSLSHWDTFPDGTTALHHTVKTPHFNAKGEVIGIVGVSRDIAEIHQVQAELSKTKQQLESVFNEMEEVVWSMSMPDMKVHFISPAAEKLFDTSLSKHQGSVGPWWKQYIHPEDAHIIDTIFQELQEVGVYDKEYRIVTETGITKHIRCRGKFIFDGNGNPKRLDGVMTDRTTEAIAHQRILDEIALQQILLQTAADFIHVEMDKVETIIHYALQNFGNYVGADRAYVFDYDIDNMLTHNTYEWCAEGVNSEIEHLQNLPIGAFLPWFEHHKQRKTFYCYDVMNLESSNPLRHILEAQSIQSVITVPMFESSKLIGFVGFDYVKEKRSLSDIQEKLLYFFADMLANTRKRQRWEVQLSVQEEKLRNILANVDMGLLEMNTNQKINYVNKAFLAMSGYHESDIINKKANELFPLAQVYENQNYIDYSYLNIAELNVIDRNHRKRWWFVSSTPNYNDKGERIGYIAVHMDITKNRELAEDLEKAKIIAEKSAKAKDLFLANMSHEIRTPLNIITGMLRQLSKETLSNQQQYYVQHTVASSRHLLSIVNDILDIAKIESGELVLEKKAFNLSALLQNVSSMFLQQVKEKNILYEVHIEKTLHPVHLGDEVRLRQVFINIIGNAIKFTLQGKVTIHVKVLQDTIDNQLLSIQIEDIGIGISQEFLQRIFTKFSQENTTANRLYQGTGLGLPISNELIQLMGGKVDVESSKGKGSLFTIFVEFPKASPAQLDNEKPIVLKDSLHNYTVLLVEDNEMNRFIAKQSLSFLGCAVTEAKNGAEAVDILKHATFDLVLMDIQMPIMDGIEATRCIRNELKLDVPIIALTANAFVQSLETYIKQGMNDYITKPFEEDVFYHTISRYLSGLSSLNTLPSTNQKDSNKIQIDTQADNLYDISQLLQISKGDKAFVNKMLTLFIQLAEQNTIDLQKELADKNILQLNKLAHKLKPSIDQMGIKILYDTIREIEKFSLETGSFTHLTSLVDQVCDVLHTVATDLRKQQ